MGSWAKQIRRAPIVTPHFGLVVVGYDSDDEWPGFFDSILRSTQLPDAIVIVDNSSSCRIPGDIGGDLGVTVLHEPKNLGYGSAANRGMQGLPKNVEWVVICNPDVRVEPDTFRILLQNIETVPNTAVLGPAIVDRQNEVFPSARAIPGVRIGIGHALLGDMWPSNPWSAAYLGNYDSIKAQSVGWLSGAFIAVRRSTFELLGGFDERYFMFFEDVDLGLRVKKMGLRNVYIPSARVKHTGAHATSHREVEMLRAHHQSAELFLSTLYSRWFHTPFRWLLKLGLRARAWIKARGLD